MNGRERAGLAKLGGWSSVVCIAQLLYAPTEPPSDENIITRKGAERVVMRL